MDLVVHTSEKGRFQLRENLFVKYGVVAVKVSLAGRLSSSFHMLIGKNDLLAVPRVYISRVIPLY